MHNTLSNLLNKPYFGNFNFNNKLKERLNQQFFIYALIFLCGLLAYYPIFYNKFQDKWDDQWVVINEYTTGGFTIDNLRSILVDYYHGQYAPANQFYYTILHSIFGYSPLAFHLASLIIHLINSSLVYLLLTKLLPLILRNDKRTINIQKLAFFSSIIFVIHPVNVEAVAWIAASKVLIYSFFYLLALNAYVDHLSQPQSINYLLISVFFILSFAGKEQAVTFPVCMVLIHFFAGGKLNDRSFWTDKIPFFIISLFFGWVTIDSQAAVGSGLMSASAQYPLYQRLVFAAYSIIEYAIKCVLPIKLSYIYPFPNVIGEPLPVRFYFYPVTLIALIVFGWETLKKPLVLFGVLFFLIHVSLLLHVIPISRFAITADRYVYISSIMGCLCISVIYVFFKNKYTNYTNTVDISMFVILTVLIGYSNVRVRVWEDSLTLKNDFKRIIESRQDYIELKGNKAR